MRFYKREALHNKLETFSMSEPGRHSAQEDEQANHMFIQGSQNRRPIASNLD